MYLLSSLCWQQKLIFEFLDGGMIGNWKW